MQKYPPPSHYLKIVLGNLKHVDHDNFKIISNGGKPRSHINALYADVHSDDKP